MDMKLATLTLAAHLQIDSDKLLAYVQEGEALGIGGYHVNASERKWDSGAVWAVEGALLYALIRYYDMVVVAEIGGYWGCSATWMAAAMKANGKGGQVYSIDSGALGADHGSKIPPELRGHVALKNGDGEAWLNSYTDRSLNMVFEDADHGSETSRRLALAALPKIADGGLYIVHDAAHDFAFLGDGSKTNVGEGKAIRAGLDAAALPYRVYLVEPSDCGFAVVKVKHEQPQTDDSPVIPEAIVIGVDQAAEEYVQATIERLTTPTQHKFLPPEEPPAPKKRTRKAKGK